NGTMELLLVSPIPPIFVILAKAVPYFALTCVNFVTILVLSVTVLGVPAAGSIAALCMMSLLFIFVSLCLGLFISTITNTQVAAMLVSGMGFMMPVMLLSGMIFPIENMPLPLQWLSHIIPAKWYIAAVRTLMIKGLGFSSVMQEFAVLGAMGIVLVAVSLKKFKMRLE
ncbi:MAG: ABC transporter permease, partial [Spirochaetota bacterium]